MFKINGQQVYFCVEVQLLVLVLFTVCTANGQNVSIVTTSPETSIKLLHILFRHGDRTPTGSYPTDPYANYSWPAGGLGQLTIRGKQRAYELGQYLRQRYGDFLSANYDPKEISVRSTDVDRTLMTAECVLAGIYPPSGDQIWDPDLPWQPIPVHTAINVTDWLNEASCPRLKELSNEVLTMPEAKEFNENHRAVYEFVQKHAGMKVQTYQDIVSVYDTLLVQAQNNITLPTWTNSVFPVPLTQISDISFKFLSYTTELKSLRAGELLKDISSHLRSAKTSGASYKFKNFLYAAHDTTVAPFLSSLDVFNDIQPPYCSAVILELHESNGAYSIKVLYRNESGREPYVLQLRDCPVLCPLGRFLSLTEILIPEDWKADCAGVTEDNENDHAKDIAIAALGVVTFCLLLLVILMYNQRRKTQRALKAYDNEGATIN